MEEIKVEDFLYFIKNEMLVAGVIEEGEDEITFVVLKGVSPRGTKGIVSRDILESELQTGKTIKIDSYEIAEMQ